MSQTDEAAADSPQLLGHPTGLYTLFFAEMWERFSYYGMRALLVFYMIKGFLGFNDSEAYTVYGAYTSLVYMTPFFGGLLADRLLGPRKAVVIGGLLMAGGHLLMTIEASLAFFTALALLIAGNGFFKPNISTMVGELYPAGSPKRDSGFTIFYMGINLGAAMSPLLCGYVGETFGWHYGFGLATIGMLVGLAIFAMPTRVSQALIVFAAVLTAVGLFLFNPDNSIAVAINCAIALALVISGVIAMRALGKGGLPDHVGQPPGGSVSPKHTMMVYGGIALAIPIFTLLVSGFSVLTASGEPVILIGEETIRSLSATAGALSGVVEIFLSEVSKPAGLVLSAIGLLATVYLLMEMFKLEKIWRERMTVALVLIFFQMLFFAFFEQAGSSMNNFTDRNVDRVGEHAVVTADMVGQTLSLEPTQEQLGYEYEGEVFNLTKLQKIREEHSIPDFKIDWPIEQSHIGMGIANRASELPASIFQSVNPGFILIFGLIFAALWTGLRTVGMDPSSPVKFALGLAQLGLGFFAMWYGAEHSSDRGMVHVFWLMMGYLFHTTGELCLSPVGLSTMTKLSARHLVSTVMGSWFLATAFSQYLAAIISQFTGVTHSSGGNVIPPPAQTVHVYGEVFYQIGLAALISAVICLALSPLLTKWMHEDVV